MAQPVGARGVGGPPRRHLFIGLPADVYSLGSEFLADHLEPGASNGIEHSLSEALERGVRKAVHACTECQGFWRQPKEISRPLATGAVTLPEPQVEMGLVGRFVL